MDQIYYELDQYKTIEEKFSKVKLSFDNLGCITWRRHSYGTSKMKRIFYDYSFGEKSNPEIIIKNTSYSLIPYVYTNMNITTAEASSQDEVLFEMAECYPVDGTDEYPSPTSKVVFKEIRRDLYYPPAEIIFNCLDSFLAMRLFNRKVKITISQ